MTSVAATIEGVILARDRRNISLLRPYLPEDYCTQAARFILYHQGPIVITTGFYIIAGKMPETDGPPGAIAISRALQALDYPVTYVTDPHVVPLLAGEEARGAKVVAFPVASLQESRAFAADLLRRVQPALCIAIERPGLSALNDYRSMRGLDVTPWTARVDELFLQHPCSVGIGDGGNEIGMGNLAEHIPLVPSLPREPNTTRVSHLVIASVSNWGAYGLAAALSLRQAQNLLPAPEREEEVIRHMVDRGAVDGIEVRPVYGVDGFSLEENRETLERLHALLRRHRLGKPLRSS